MDTRIYVHGRPQGQDIWSPREDSTDRFYIEPFLDSRVGSDVDSAMIIDIWQKHCYYTYIRCKNVVEKSVRPNAYFAITVRFDGICKNVASLYNLLDLIYNKVCLGNLIANENGQEHILVNHWTEKENVLQQINTLISQNIEKVILPYVSAIDNLKDTKNASIQIWSLQDIDCPLFVSSCQNHRIVISPHYKSKDRVHEDDMKRVAPLEAECAKLKDQVSQWTAKYESTENARAILENKTQNLSVEIDTLKNELKTIREEATSQFKGEISKLKTEKQKVDDELRDVRKDLNERTKRNEELQKKCVQLEKKLKGGGGPYGGPVNDKDLELVCLMAERFPVLRQNGTSKTSAIVKQVSSWLSIVNTILLIALIGCLCYFVKQHTNNVAVEVPTTPIEINDTIANITDTIATTVVESNGNDKAEPSNSKNENKE